MFTNKISAFLLAATVAVISFSCTKSSEVDPIDPNGKGDLTLEFDNYVGGTNLKLGTTPYKNATGEDFTVTTFNYFVSNVELTKSDGSVVKMANSYFLVREADAASQLVKLTGVPQADYKSVKFTIGVDSLKSISPVTERVGVLDPASYGTDNMYWSWNSGYIFMKFSGVSSVAPARADGTRLVEIHVGGYGGGFNGAAKTLNNLRTVTLPLTEAATVRSNISPDVHLIVDAAKMIDNSSKISFTTVNNVHSPAVAGPIADNYKGMFIVDHVHNDKQ